jgi:hypothetical protein
MIFTKEKKSAREDMGLERRCGFGEAQLEVEAKQKLNTHGIQKI